MATLDDELRPLRPVELAQLRQVRLEHARLGVLAQPPGQPHRAPLRLGVGLGERLRVGLALVGGAGGVPDARAEVEALGDLGVAAQLAKPFNASAKAGRMCGLNCCGVGFAAPFATAAFAPRPGDTPAAAAAAAAAFTGDAPGPPPPSEARPPPPPPPRRERRRRAAPWQ